MSYAGLRRFRARLRRKYESAVYVRSGGKIVRMLTRAEQQEMRAHIDAVQSRRLEAMLFLKPTPRVSLNPWTA